MNHHFATFGFVKIPGFFTPGETLAISHEFDATHSRPGIKACCADSNPRLISLIGDSHVYELIGDLLGPSWLYKGSDGNVFLKATPWHRDYFIRTPTCKMLIYLDPSTLELIPGSHFVDGPFAKHLNAALTWPEPPVQGGFNEKMLLYNDDVPHVKVATVPGDVIVFNHNVIHRTSIDGRRRLLGLHFAAEFTEEVKELTLIEMRTFNVPTCYGPCVQRTERTAPFFDLRNDAAGSFSGRYEEQSGESIRFGKRWM